MLLLFTNDFVTMSIATDRVTFARSPDRWDIGSLVATGLSLAIPILMLTFAVFLWAHDWLRLPLAETQTLIFCMLVFSGQGTVYLVRERRHFWSSWPSPWKLLSSVSDIVIVSLLASLGILMAPVRPALVVEVLGLVILFLVALDFLKIRTLEYMRPR